MARASSRPKESAKQSSLHRHLVPWSLHECLVLSLPWMCAIRWVGAYINQYGKRPPNSWRICFCFAFFFSFEITFCRRLEPGHTGKSNHYLLAFEIPPKDWNKLNIFQWWKICYQWGLVPWFKATENLAPIRGREKCCSVAVLRPWVIGGNEGGWHVFSALCTGAQHLWQRPEDCGIGNLMSPGYSLYRMPTMCYVTC